MFGPANNRRLEHNLQLEHRQDKLLLDLACAEVWILHQVELLVSILSLLASLHLVPHKEFQLEDLVRWHHLLDEEVCNFFKAFLNFFSL